MAGDKHDSKRQKLLSRWVTFNDTVALRILTFDSMFSSGDYSDLTITSHGQTFTVHKVIICHQSAFFRNACKKNAFKVCHHLQQYKVDTSDFSKEGETGLIDLPDDDDTAVKAMIEFMYASDYTTPDDTAPFLFHSKTPASRTSTKSMLW